MDTIDMGRAPRGPRDSVQGWLTEEMRSSLSQSNGICKKKVLYFGSRAQVNLTNVKKIGQKNYMCSLSQSNGTCKFLGVKLKGFDLCKKYKLNVRRYLKNIAKCHT